MRYDTRDMILKEPHRRHEAKSSWVQYGSKMSELGIAIMDHTGRAWRSSTLR